MPAKSDAQYRLMQAAKHNPEVRKRTGITEKVAEDYTKTPPPASIPGHSAKAKALRSRMRY